MPTVAQLNVLVRLDARGFNAAARQADRDLQAAVRSLRSGVGDLEGAIHRLGKAQNDVARGFKFGLGAISARGFVDAFGAAGDLLTDLTKRAIRMNDALIEVAKPLQLNLRGNGEDRKYLAQLRQDLIAITDAVPGTRFEGLAEIAKIGAKMNVNKEDLANFTKGVGMASVAIKEMSPEELAEGVASLAGGFKISADQSFYFASAIAKAADMTKGSFREILKVSNRAVPTAANVRVKPADLIAMSSAIKDTRMLDYAAGGAMNRFINMLASTDKLASMGKLMGKTREEMEKMRDTDPGTGLIEFLDALRLKGIEGNQILEDMGITDTNDKAFIMSMANQIKVISDVQKEMNKELKDGGYIVNTLQLSLEQYSTQVEIFQAKLDKLADAFKAGLLGPLTAVTQHMSLLVGEFSDFVAKSPEWQKAMQGLTKAVDVFFEMIRDPKAAFDVFNTALDLAIQTATMAWNDMLEGMYNDLLVKGAKIAAKAAMLTNPAALAGWVMNEGREVAPGGSKDVKAVARKNLLQSQLDAKIDELAKKGEARRNKLNNVDISSGIPKSTEGQLPPIPPDVAAAREKDRTDRDRRIDESRISVQRMIDQLPNLRGRDQIQAGERQIKEALETAAKSFGPTGEGMKKDFAAALAQAVSKAEIGTKIDDKRRELAFSGADQMRSFLQNRALNSTFDQLDARANRQVASLDAAGFDQMIRDGINSGGNVQQQQLEVQKKMVEIQQEQYRQWAQFMRDFGELGG